MIRSFCYHGGCVDVEFVKSSFSGNGGCVEVGAKPVDDEDGIAVLVRDSKNPDKPPHEFNRREWDAFLKGVKAGEFDLEA